MKPEERDDGHLGPWILFPEIIGVSILVIVALVCLVRLLLSGYVLAGLAGLALWSTVVFFAVRFIRRRQYFLAYLLILAILGLCYLFQRGLK